MLQDSGTPSLPSPLAFVCLSRAAGCLLSVGEDSHWVLEKRAPDPPTSRVGGRVGLAVQGSITAPSHPIIHNHAKQRASVFCGEEVKGHLPRKHTQLNAEE